MSLPKSILTVGRDHILQDIRALVLEKAGYQVVQVMSDKVAIDAVQTLNNFSLVLLCHSVPEINIGILATAIKAWNPNLPILMLYYEYPNPYPKVDGLLHALDPPDALLQMISVLTKRFAADPGSIQ